MTGGNAEKPIGEALKVELWRESWDGEAEMENL